jgi:hypothetical protein
MMRFHDVSRECAQYHRVSSSFQTMFDRAGHLSGFPINDKRACRLRLRYRLVNDMRIQYHDLKLHNIQCERRDVFLILVS